MTIPSDFFARRDYRRTGSVPYECLICGLVFLSDEGCKQHTMKRHDSQYCWHRRQCQPLLPGVSISLLQTCRIIRFEASPILYSRNSFHFSNPATARRFRLGTDCTQAGELQELGISLGCTQATPWLRYLTNCTHSLGHDFPNLRRMTIKLDMGSQLPKATFLRFKSEKLGERSHGLEWVLVLMPTNDDIELDWFEPLVNRKDDSKNGTKAVQRRVWASAINPLFEYALLWWGCPGEAMPRKYRVIGDQPQQQVSSDLDGQGELHAADN